ncbi:MAG: hypothetical protein ACD_79C00122G0002 [uncultured bacterium]|nr:MAG: hypothetical protein ACD_79C00122G0002 [uncultured bacterium]
MVFGFECEALMKAYQEHLKIQEANLAPSPWHGSIPIDYAIDCLILNVDLNQTIVAVDKVQGKNIDKIVLTALTIAVKGMWQENGKYESFYDYAYGEGVRLGRDRFEKKKIKEEIIKSFFSVLHKADIAFHDQMFEIYQSAVAIRKKQKTIVSQSFYNLIETLQTCKIPFRIILRTFGNEGNEVAKEIQKHTQINFKTGTFNENYSFEYGGETKEIIEMIALKKVFSLMQLDHWCIKDNWLHWNINGEKFDSGKLFLFDLSSRVHSMFFDDNIFPSGSIKNIVHPFCVTPFCQGTDSKIDELISRKILVPVDFLQTIFDEHYFEKHVIESLKIRSIKDNTADNPAA